MGIESRLLKIGKRKLLALVMGVFLLLLLIYAGSRMICLGQDYTVVVLTSGEEFAFADHISFEKTIQEVRKSYYEEEGTLVFQNLEYTEKKERVLGKKLLSEKELKESIQAAIEEKAQDVTLAYGVSVGEFSAILESEEDLQTFLTDVKADYDEDNRFSPAIVASGDKESDSYQAILLDSSYTAEATDLTSIGAGVVRVLGTELSDVLDNPEDNHYQTGLIGVQYADEVHVYRVLAHTEDVISSEEAVATATKQEETNKIYTVKSGDSLSEIADTYGLTTARLCEINGFSTSQTIYIDQEIIVSVPEPDLGITTKEGIVYEEDYEADPTIIENDDWYTTESVTLEEGTVGHREVNAVVTYENGIATSQNMIHTTVMVESTPAVVEQGTIIPPTYIKPISGGTYSSGFGKRWGRMHKGVDWAVPTGTTVFASSAGVVEYAGWSSGYGYNVLISHPDGRKTRYAHLSKVLVSVGQSVEQGETIAKSGSTGRSTGPHLHFEILINGTQVNPLNYIS